MGNEFEAFIQTAVRFDVKIFSILIRNIKQLLRVAVHRAAVINFELNAEVAQTFSVEHEVWRVAILVDNFAVLIPAGCAVSVVVAVPVRAVAVDNPATVIAADVVLIKAVIAEYVRVILNSIFLVDSLGAVVADYG